MVEQLTTIEEIRAFLEIDDSVSGITAGDIANWNAAYGWGDHAGAGYLTSETDPVYTASSWFGTTNNSGNWNTAFGWGNHAGAGYLTSLPSHTHPLSEITQSGATTNQVPSWSGSAWVPTTISTSNIYNADGTLTGNRALTLDTYTFSIKKASNTYFHVFNNGRVWIGNGTPADAGFAFDVQGASRIVGNLNIGSTSAVGVGNITSILKFTNGTENARIEVTQIDPTYPQNQKISFFAHTVNAAVFSASYNRIDFDAPSYFNADINVPSASQTWRFAQSGGNNAGIDFSGAFGKIIKLQGYYITLQGNANECFQATDGTNVWMRLRGDGNLLIGTTTNIASALVNITSTSKGFLMPRMTTTQVNAISSPATGLEAYDTTLNSPKVYDATAWRHSVLAPNSTKVTAAAPYTNDGYVEVIIGGVTFKLMTTA